MKEPILSDFSIANILFLKNKKNAIVKKLLLSGDKSKPELHLRQSGFTYKVCGPFSKNKERLRKFKGTVDSKFIYQSKLEKACFQHDMPYGDFKD